MLFASTIFLCVFLPIAILCYYTQRVFLGNRFRNIILLLLSYLFYLYGASGFLLLLVASTAADFLLALLIEHRRGWSRLWVTLSVTLNLGLLAYFKYANFLMTQLSGAMSALGHAAMPEWTAVVLPLGISFFTFQKLSYIIDVHRGQARALTRPVDFALFVAMFPQLVAGPIVRFKDIWDQLKHRQESWGLFYMGVIRFCWGLSKKVLIADACGHIADSVFGTDMALLSTQSAWLGAVAYTFQIYFDFSAYSDMAIGLGRMFGFELLENFNRPYAAVSLTDFWRRWHISLSNWFRDYLYIPMGGNQKGAWRTAMNLLVVFGLCGLWHGANWTFIVWGFYHGFFLGFERLTGIRKIPAERWQAIRRLIAFLIIVFGWVLFRSETLAGALDFMRVMVVPTARPMTFDLYQALNYRNLFFVSIAAVAVIGAARFPNIEQVLQSGGVMLKTVGIALIFLLLPYCAAFILAGASNPFIYYRF